MRVALLLPVALCCAALAAPASAAVRVDRPGPAPGQPIIKTQAMPYGYSGGGYGQPYGYSGGGYGQPYGYSGGGYGQPYGYSGGGYGQPYGYSGGGYAQRYGYGGYGSSATPYGYGGSYGQPSPPAGIPGSWQPSASSHPASDYYYGYR